MGISLGSITAYAIPVLLTTGFSQGEFESGNIQSQGSFPGAESTFTSYTPVISLQFFGIAMISSIIVTLIASFYPTWKIFKLSLVDALRYE